MTKPITETRLYNITLFYLERFEASSFKTKQMLEKRIQKEQLKGSIIPDNIDTLIQNVIKKMTSLGYINDDRYVQNQVRNLSNAGKSKSFIIKKLQQSGLNVEKIKESLSLFDEENNSSDLTRAEKWLKKHKKGQFRTKDANLYYQKDLAALARAGFSFDVATRALKTFKQEEDYPY